MQDRDSAVFLSSPSNASLYPGDRVIIKGKTQGSFRPIVVAGTITLLHVVAMPEPTPATFDQLISAKYDRQLVRVRAKVRAADIVSSTAGLSERSARSQLLMDGGHIEADVDSEDVSSFKSMLDDEVEITGVVAGRFEDKMQLTGIVRQALRE